MIASLQELQGKKVLVVGLDKFAYLKFKRDGAEEVWMVAPDDPSRAVGFADHYIHSPVQSLNTDGLEGKFDVIYNQLVDCEIGEAAEWNALMDKFKTLLKRDGVVEQRNEYGDPEVIAAAYQAAFEYVDIGGDSVCQKIIAHTPRLRHLEIGTNTSVAARRDQTGISNER